MTESNEQQNYRRDSYSPKEKLLNYTENDNELHFEERNLD